MESSTVEKKNVNKFISELMIEFSQNLEDIRYNLHTALYPKVKKPVKVDAPGMGGLPRHHIADVIRSYRDKNDNLERLNGYKDYILDYITYNPNQVVLVGNVNSLLRKVLNGFIDVLVQINLKLDDEDKK